MKKWHFMPYFVQKNTKNGGFLRFFCAFLFGGVVFLSFFGVGKNKNAHVGVFIYLFRTKFMNFGRFDR